MLDFAPCEYSLTLRSRVRETRAELGRRFSVFEDIENVARLVFAFRTELARRTNADFIGAAFTGPLLFLRAVTLSRFLAFAAIGSSFTVFRVPPKVGLPLESFDDGLLTDEYRVSPSYWN